MINREQMKPWMRRIEEEYFRTEIDIGANVNALIIWNRVRRAHDLPDLTKANLEQRRYDSCRPEIGDIPHESCNPAELATSYDPVVWVSDNSRYFRTGTFYGEWSGALDCSAFHFENEDDFKEES